MKISEMVAKVTPTGLTKKDRIKLEKAKAKADRADKLMNAAMARIAVVIHRVPPNHMIPGFYGYARGYMMDKKLTRKQLRKIQDIEMGL